MRHNSLHRVLAVGVLALGLLATAASPVSASSPSASKTSNQWETPASALTALETPPGDVLSVRGAGPYRIGARLQALQAAGLIDWVAPQEGCDVLFTGVTGDWSGALILAFRDGRLVEVGTAGAPPLSPAGASVGMTWDELEDIYGSRGDVIYSDDGRQAYAVRIGSRVELYTGHPIRAGVGYYQAGLANFILPNFAHGSVC